MSAQYFKHQFDGRDHFYKLENGSTLSFVCATDSLFYAGIEKADGDKVERLQRVHSVACTAEEFEAAYQKAVENLTLTALQPLKEWTAWSLKNFPKADSVVFLSKAEEEIRELKHEIITNSGDKDKLFEAADVLLALLNALDSEGFTVEALFQAAAAKARINYEREWQYSEEAGNYYHVKVCNTCSGSGLTAGYTCWKCYGIGKI